MDLARDAAVEIGYPEWVGEHLSAYVEGDRVVTHLFACLDPAYSGWRYAITVARASRAKKVTVNEAVLLPGAEALLAPEWVPWKERLRPGDLGVGDLLPSADDDDRLKPGYAQVPGDELEEGADQQMVWELGLGRPRVLSEFGRESAAERWYNGEGGPHSAIAAAAPAKCATCGFMTPLAGEFRQMFGACANELAPDDGRVVSLDHGCGAHSEASTGAVPTEAPLRPVIDELGYDHIVFDDTSELELVSSDG
ncbi:DUF3027 domain-containing protein [Streptomonospora sediminis]